jgi:hypothetical protein
VDRVADGGGVLARDGRGQFDANQRHGLLLGLEPPLCPRKRTSETASAAKRLCGRCKAAGCV